MNTNTTLRRHVFREYHGRKLNAVSVIQCVTCGSFVFHTGRGAHLKRYCSLCLIKADQANSARYRNKYPDKCAEARHRRRAAKKGVESESFTLADVVSQFGTNCHLCNELIDMKLPWPNPFSKSLDHIIPISKGGPHKLSNVKLAHLTCNQRKSGKL